ncbi:hypothetical protein ACTFIT_001933 [Dictyostelium discoideum]
MEIKYGYLELMFENIVSGNIEIYGTNEYIEKKFKNIEYLHINNKNNNMYHKYISNEYEFARHNLGNSKHINMVSKEADRITQESYSSFFYTLWCMIFIMTINQYFELRKLLLLKKNHQLNNSKIDIKFTSNNTIILILLLIICFIDFCIGSCDVTIPLGQGISVVDLDDGRGILSRKISGTYSFVIPKTSFKACLTAVGSSGKATNFEISIDNYRQVTSSSIEYWTSDWTCEIASVTKCHKQSGSGCGSGTCGGIKKNERDCQGNLKNQITLYGVLRLGEPTSVTTVKSVNVYYDINIKQNGVKIESVGINDASKDVNIQLDSFSKDTDTSIINTNSTTYKNTRYITSVSPRNSPTIRWVGDVQWSTYEKEVASSFDSAIAPGIFGNGVKFVKGKPVKSTIDCSISGLKLLANSKNTKFNGPENVWTYNNQLNEWETHPLTHCPWYLVLNFNGNYSIINKVDVTCPEVKDVRYLYGCRKCESGSSLSLQIKSSCKSGIAIIMNSNKDVNLITTTAALTTSFTNLTIRYKTNLKEVKDSFCFYDSMYKNTTTNKHDIGENGDEGFNLFKNIKSLVGGVLKLPFKIFNAWLDLFGSSKIDQANSLIKKNN